MEMGTGQEGQRTVMQNWKSTVSRSGMHGRARTHTHTDGQCKNIMFPAPVCWMSGGIKYPEEPNVFTGR